MMMALAAMPALPSILVPGGVTLLAEGGEDAGKVQSVGARYARGQMTAEAAAEALCHSCATPGGGCQFLGTAATSQVVGEALGMTLGARRAGALRTPHLDRHGAPLGPRRAVARSPRPGDARYPDGRLRAQCHGGARGLRRVDQPDPAPAGHRPRGGPGAPGDRRLGAHQPPGPPPGGRAAQRAGGPSHGAGFPGGRRSRGDAALAPRRPARNRRSHRQRRKTGRRARLVGAIRTPRGAAAGAARERRHRPRRRHHGPRRRAAARHHLHGDVSHRATSRPEGRWSRARPSTPRCAMPMASTARPVPRACSAPRKPPSRPSRTAPSAPATCWC